MEYENKYLLSSYHVPGSMLSSFISGLSIKDDSNLKAHRCMYEIKLIIYKVILCISKYLISETVTFIYNAIRFSSLLRVNYVLGTGPQRGY